MMGIDPEKSACILWHTGDWFNGRREALPGLSDDDRSAPSFSENGFQKVFVVSAFAFFAVLLCRFPAPYALTEPSASPETTKRFWKTAKSAIMGIWARIEAAKIHSQRVA